MRSSLWIASVLATAGMAAPTYNGWTAAATQDSQAISTYFNGLAQNVQQQRSTPGSAVCNLNAAVMPVAPTPLPGPSAGLTLKHVAIGRGTQNYTCPANNATAVPTAIGAEATLFNASCIAATSPAVLASLPNFALQFNLAADQTLPNPANLLVSGHHFFETVTTPFFDLDTTALQLGEAACSKNNTTPAPSTAEKGQGGVGNGAVPWLKLIATTSTGNLQEVYRLNTAGGAAPATCSGMPTAFEIQYAAQYWFWQK